jgi:hypothetical protein
MTKICSCDGCEFAGKPQPITNFYNNIARYDGLANYCKKCALRKKDERKSIIKSPVTTGEKVCSKCKISQPVDNFAIYNAGRDGRYPRCRSCVLEIRRAYNSILENWTRQSENKKIARLGRREINAQTLQSYWDSLANGSPEKSKICAGCGGAPQTYSNFQISLEMKGGLSKKCRKCLAKVDRSRYHTSHEEKWSKRAIHSIRDRAKNKGIPFDIKQSDLLDPLTGKLPEFCPLFPNVRMDYSSGPDRRKWASVDRIVPELGYIPGNVCVISNGANTWKNNGSSPAERKRIIQIIGRLKKPSKDVSSLQRSLFNL